MKSTEVISSTILSRISLYKYRTVFSRTSRDVAGFVDGRIFTRMSNLSITCRYSPVAELMLVLSDPGFLDSNFLLLGPNKMACSAAKLAAEGVCGAVPKLLTFTSAKT